jgi:undecaprenyl-diphosphatase
VLAALIWGLIQGLTEFLPVSSSGHLVIVPAFLARLGMDIAQPDLAISAVLHLGTLLAVILHFRSDIARMLRFRSDREGRKLLTLIVIGTLPIVVGLPLQGSVERLQESLVAVGWALIGTAVILVIGQRMARGERTLESGRPVDAVTVGIAQVLALIPGISRSGATIAAGTSLGFQPYEAARFSFLLGLPAIAGAGILQLPDLARAGRLDWDLAVGFAAAAVSGYLAISLLLAAIRKVGLLPFAVYAATAGVLTLVIL